MVKVIWPFGVSLLLLSLAASGGEATPALELIASIPTNQGNPNYVDTFPLARLANGGIGVNLTGEPFLSIDLKSRKAFSWANAQQGPIYALPLSGGRIFLVGGYYGNHMQFFDRSGALLSEIPADSDSACRDRICGVWRLHDGNILSHVDDHLYFIDQGGKLVSKVASDTTFMAVLPSKDRVATATFDGNLVQYDLKGKQLSKWINPSQTTQDGAYTHLIELKNGDYYLSYLDPKSSHATGYRISRSGTLIWKAQLQGDQDSEGARPIELRDGTIVDEYSAATTSSGGTTFLSAQGAVKGQSPDYGVIQPVRFAGDLVAMAVSASGLGIFDSNAKLLATFEKGAGVPFTVPLPIGRGRLVFGDGSSPCLHVIDRQAKELVRSCDQTRSIVYALTGGIPLGSGKFAFLAEDSQAGFAKSVDIYQLHK